MRVDGAKHGERVQVEASRSKRIQSIACHQALYTLHNPPLFNTVTMVAAWKAAGLR